MGELYRARDTRLDRTVGIKVLNSSISRDPKSGLPVRDFGKEDFRVFDNRREIRITTFDAGVQYDTRPITLWLVVICNEGGLPKFGASVEFRGQESLFRPALNHLQTHDGVGVADCCDNGDTRLVLLHGDHTGQPRRELDQLVDDFLETSGIVFGIRDYRSPELHFIIGEQAKIMHFMAEHTGGQYFSAPPSKYEGALYTILMQLHFRYELGFIPPAIDGKRHKLRVELTKEAKAEHKGLRLRYRPEYIPVREEPDWVH